MADPTGRATGELRGTTPSRMEYLAWGAGPRTMLFIAGGPPSTLPEGLFGRSVRRYLAPYTEAGYRVWTATRRRGMPRGHLVPDIAADYAEFVRDVVRADVDLLVGQSFGGLVAQHLAPLLGDRVHSVVLVASGWRVSDAARETDLRLAAAIEAGDLGAAGAAYAEYLMPAARLAPVRRLLGPVLARTALSGRTYGPEDVLVEVAAEAACDTRAVLPGIRTPTLIAAGDRDWFFPEEITEETARLIPGARLLRLPGKGHLGVSTSGRVTEEVLADPAD